MQPAAPEASTCPNCGGALEKTPRGELGCMSCLLRAGIGSEEKTVHDSNSGASESGVRFGVYEIDCHTDGSLCELGRGAMGITYRATDTSLQRKVALKIIKTDIAERSADARERFMREARAAAALRHEHIATVYQFGMRLETGQYFYAMELIEGETLDDRVRRAGPLDARTTIGIGQQVTSALAAAEKHGLVHRDLKPANLMLVNPEDRELTGSDQTGSKRSRIRALRKSGIPVVKIIDFGLAKAFHTATDSKSLTHDRFVGTPAFASPEQFEHSALDVRSDIYSLGETLWFALTGKPPFGGRSIEEIHRAQKSDVLPVEQLKAAHVPFRLRSLIESMLAFEPASRPGTSELAAQLQRCSPEVRSVRRTRFSLAATSLMVLGMSAAIIFLWVRTQNSIPNLGAPEKSIAVLPFENRSEDKANAYFADGVQDEILTYLAKIADLKVISRTSVMPYKSGMARNLRQISQQLGVAHVVEGSVQRSGSRVRVNAQLVDARTDRHLWAQTYDRDLVDVFAIQSAIAKAIADQLQAKLSPSEKNAIERPPTTDVSAFDLYARAKVLLHASRSTEENVQAVDLLTQAVAHDPSFFDAYCQLAYANGWLYFLGVDHTSARLALAEAALQAASRLRPDAGETHLARGQNLYWGYHDYDGALAELEVARQTLPNDARIFRLTGTIQRRQGHWEESTRNLERAAELDPRDIESLQGVAVNYWLCRRYPEAKRWYARVLAFKPNDALTKVLLAYVDFAWKADTGPLHQTIDSIRATNLAAVPSIAQWWLYYALAERDGTAAKNALIASSADAILFTHNVPLNRLFIEGVIARMIKDNEKARSAFSAARVEQEKIVQAQPNYGPALCVLGLIDAGLGRKDDALREGQRAVELLPVEKDAMEGAAMIKYLAMIAAWVGNKDLACEQLAVVIRRPSGLSYGELKLLPWWDPLRGDPRFEKLVEEAKLPVSLSESEPGSHSDGNFASVPEKSIAVLPFENLSSDKENAYFADGIQDEILTRLSKIADLKVISRTSTQHYKSAPENLPEIAKQLGVAHILEGRVQKSGDAVRVNVQLIKAVNDSHLWADTFDRKLTDIFSVESEIAKRIAESLQAKLTGREEQALAVKSTNNPEAYDAYLRGVAFEARTGYKPDFIRKAAGFYERAVQLDPNFAVAWARLSRANAHLYSMGLDPGGTARGDAAKRALEQAQNLEPNSPETLLALGYYQFWVLHDYGPAKTTFQGVSKVLPSNGEVPLAIGRITVREGHGDQSIAHYERGLTLDPRNMELLGSAAWTYTTLRQFPAALKLYDRALDIIPNKPDVIAEKASIYQAQGNLEEAARLLAGIHEQTDITNSTKIVQLRLERNYGEAIRLQQARLAQYQFASETQKAMDQLSLAFMQLLAGDTAGARLTAEQARTTFDERHRDQPDRSLWAAYLSQAYAVMGEKDSALKLAERAIALQPSAKDHMAGNGPALEENLALIQTIFGENSRAIAILTQLLQTPYTAFFQRTPITPALLRLDPLWDPLRSDPAFQRLCEEKQP